MLVGSQGTVPAATTGRRPLRPLRHRPHRRSGPRPARPDCQRHLRNAAQRRLRTVHRDDADHRHLTVGTANVTFRYSTPAANVSAKNWIGIYPAGVAPGKQSSLAWAYAPDSSGAATFSTGKLSGPGNYDVYYLANDGYSVLAGPFSLAVG